METEPLPGIPPAPPPPEPNDGLTAERRAELEKSALPLDLLGAWPDAPVLPKPKLLQVWRARLRGFV